MTKDESSAMDCHQLVEAITDYLEGALPAEERDVVGLLFYHGLPQAEAAALLGVTVRTVQRRWQAALVKLHRILNDAGPIP